MIDSLVKIGVAILKMVFLVVAIRIALPATLSISLPTDNYFVISRAIDKESGAILQLGQIQKGTDGIIIEKAYRLEAQRQLKEQLRAAPKTDDQTY
jgi:hypothetical protein